MRGRAGLRVTAAPPRSSDRWSASRTSTTSTAAGVPKGEVTAQGHRRDEVLALQPERLRRRSPGAENVARPGLDVLAVGAGTAGNSRFLVHHQLAVGLHVVEHGHPLRAHDCQAPKLLGIEPREVQMRRDAALEPEVTEDHVCDVRAEIRVAARAHLGRPVVE